MKPTKASTQKYRLLAAMAAIVIMAGWVASLRASMPYFVSTTGADSNDCFTLASACQHITAALGKASAGDVIIIADGTYTENLTLSKDITLIGFGQEVTTLSGGGIARVMTITANTTVNLSDVTIADGSTGYPYLGSGIFVSGTLRLFNSTLTRNSSSFAIYNVGTFEGQALLIHNNDGGAIYTTGAGALRDSLVANNIAGIWNYGTMQLSDSAILSHTTNLWPGAGIANYGVMAIDHGLIRANRINDASGAGVYNAGIISISNSLIISNTAYHVPPHVATTPQALEAWGGGIHNDIYPFGTMTITNSALYGNSADSGGDQINNGGSAYLVNVTVSGDAGHHGIDNGAWMTLTNVTISDMPSGLATGGGNIFVHNTIVTVLCIGMMTSLGHNLDSGNTCGFTTTGDLTNTDPLLGPLQDNGGPTPTYAIPANSPAVNAGDNVGCPATDQRGVARPQAGRCDIGAYEYVFPIKLFLPVIKR